MFAWLRKLGGAPAPTHCSVEFMEGHAPIQVPRDAFLLAAALDAGVPWPHNCKVGTCGACKTRVLEGRIRPAMDFALSPLTAEELREGYVLACQSRVRSDLRVEVPLDAAAHPAVHREAIVQSARQVAEGVMHLQLQLDAPLQFAAGQYANLRLLDHPAVRSYSICEAPAPGGRREVSFLLRRLPGGAFSERLFRSAAPGLRMGLHGPFGASAAMHEDLHILGVAGGTGLAPMLSLIDDRLSRSTQARFTLLLGLRSRHDDFATEQLQPLHERFPGRIQVQTWLSDEPAGSAWQGPRGLVVDGIDRTLLERSGVDGAFLCGNAALVHTARERLVALGMPASAIHADAFSPSAGGPSPRVSGAQNPAMPEDAQVDAA